MSDYWWRAATDVLMAVALAVALVGVAWDGASAADERPALKVGSGDAAAKLLAKLEFARIECGVSSDKNAYLKLLLPLMLRDDSSLLFDLTMQRLAREAETFTPNRFCEGLIEALGVGPEPHEARIVIEPQE